MMLLDSRKRRRLGQHISTRIPPQQADTRHAQAELTLLSLLLLLLDSEAYNSYAILGEYPPR